MQLLSPSHTVYSLVALGLPRNPRVHTPSPQSPVATLTQGAFPMHWPLVNAPGSMLEKMALKELEAKKREDALM